MNFFRTNIAMIAAIALLGACGGGDGGVDPGPAPDIVASPSFGTDIKEIFDRRGCAVAGCHGSQQSGGLDLRSGASYAELVNVTSEGEAAYVRVVPSDATNSYLVIKLEGRQTFGDRMPISGGALDNVDLTNIKNWINAGALNN